MILKALQAGNMASVTDFSTHSSNYLNSEVSRQIAEKLKSMEAVLFEKLSDSHLKIEQQAEFDIESLRTVAQLQCALDIVQSAKTAEEKATVYDILKQLKKSVPG